MNVRRRLFSKNCLSVIYGIKPWRILASVYNIPFPLINLYREYHDDSSSQNQVTIPLLATNKTSRFCMPTFPRVDPDGSTCWSLFFSTRFPLFLARPWFTQNFSSRLCTVALLSVAIVIRPGTRFNVECTVTSIASFQPLISKQKNIQMKLQLTTIFL